MRYRQMLSLIHISTFDGIAMSTFRIVESILKNQNTVLPVAHVLGQEYGESLEGSCISIPCVVNEEGIAKTIKITMTCLLYTSEPYRRCVWHTMP